MTYADLANQLDVSEATIKRLFTSTDASFSRLQEIICDVLEISLSDLLLLPQQQKEKSFRLSLEQEQFFVDNPNYFEFFQEIVENGLQPKEIQKKHTLNNRSLHQYLRQLETLGILEWMPGDRVKMKFRGSHSFLDGGPLQKAYSEKDSQAFLAYLYANRLEKDRFLTTSDRYIHPETLAAYIAELKALASSYRKKAYRDEIYYPKEQLTRATWLVGIAPYNREVGSLVCNIKGKAN